MPDEKQLELLRNNFRKASAIYIKKMFEKKSNGILFKFNRLSLNKIGCIKSVQQSIKNGFEPEDHFEVAKEIKKLFEESQVIEEHYKSKPERFERQCLCVCKIFDDVYAWMNVVTWGKEEGYIGFYLSREAE
ncbi:MAG: hypothetical protein J6T31_07525 [Methanobrevibacter sp.]|nr:hypothetical protein [Methanobrevibacter sp.]